MTIFIILKYFLIIIFIIIGRSCYIFIRFILIEFLNCKFLNYLEIKIIII